MRTISSELITEAVKELCIKANKTLPDDVISAITAAKESEPWESASGVLQLLCDNISLALDQDLPICQDTGVTCVYVDIGQDVHIEGDLEKAINDGVMQGYEEGFLRKSVVADPLRRVNTETNTPAFINVHIVSGEAFIITVMPKGFGSENMSRLSMLKPSDGVDGVCNFVLETVRLAGPNPCPPIVIGVGIGGTFDTVAALAKRALMRPIGQQHPDKFYAGLEAKLLNDVNALGIGPQGFGGKTTALSLAIESAATHVAGLPVAVNINCHVTRRATAAL